MACPFFYPLAKSEGLDFLVPPRLPLGDPYSGRCEARPEAFSPAEAVLIRSCNSGYSRGVCDRFPAGSAIDAVRFHIQPPAGDTIHIQFVLEKDCWPAAHGLLEYSRAGGTFASVHENALIQRQAEACVESFLRRAPL